jgi:prevent-host-death family protein
MMKQFTATEAKNILGQIFDAAQVEPVRITKNGKDFVVVLSAAQFERLHKSEPRRNLVAAFHEDSMNRYADVYAELAK